MKRNETPTFLRNFRLVLPCHGYPHNLLDPALHPLAMRVVQLIVMATWGDPQGPRAVRIEVNHLRMPRRDHVIRRAVEKEHRPRRQLADGVDGAFPEGEVAFLLLVLEGPTHEVAQ